MYNPKQSEHYIEEESECIRYYGRVESSDVYSINVPGCTIDDVVDVIEEPVYDGEFYTVSLPFVRGGIDEHENGVAVKIDRKVYDVFISETIGFQKYSNGHEPRTQYDITPYAASIATLEWSSCELGFCDHTNHKEDLERPYHEKEVEILQKIFTLAAKHDGTISYTI